MGRLQCTVSALCPESPKRVLKLWCTFLLSVSDTHKYRFDKIKSFMMYLYFKRFDPIAWTKAEGENCGCSGACIYTINFIKKYWYWILILQYILDLVTDTASVFFRLITLICQIIVQQILLIFWENKHLYNLIRTYKFIILFWDFSFKP